MGQNKIGLRARVRRRANGKCEVCGSRIIHKANHPRSGSIHHRKPRRIGGKDTFENLVLLCLDCHRNIHRDERYSGLKGWIVWLEPDLTPLWVRREFWAYLDGDGYRYVSAEQAQGSLDWLHAYAQAVEQSKHEDRLTAAA